MDPSIFWHWFTANETKLRSFHTLSESERNELLKWFAEHLKYYSPRLGYRIIIPPEQKHPPTLAFSALGDAEARKHILNLMEAAPKFENWIISASITSLPENDPDYFENEYCLNGVCCKPSNIKFWGELIDPETGQFILGIILDFPVYKIEPDFLRQIVGIVLTDTLGELMYDRYIEDFIIHSEIPEDEEVFELYDLKMYLEGL